MVIIERLDALWQPADLSGDGGIVKVLIEQEVEKMHPAVGDRVFFHYELTLDETGELLYSTKETNEEAQIVIGAAENHSNGWRGLDAGLGTMKLGQVARITCRSDYAFGEEGRSLGQPNVPPNATVCFEVELKRIWDFGETILQEPDGSVCKSLQKAGVGFDHPRIGALGDPISLVTVDVTGFSGERCFIRKEVIFELGEAHSVNLPDGVDFAIERFKDEERSLVKCTGKWAYGAQGSEHFSIPPNADVVFDLHLKRNDVIQSRMYNSQKQKIDEGDRWKVKGMRFFKEAKYFLALNKFREVIDLLELLGDKDMITEGRKKMSANAERNEREEKERKKQLLREKMGMDWDSDWESDEEQHKSVIYRHKEMMAKIAKGETEDVFNKPRPGTAAFKEDWGEQQTMRDRLYFTCQMNAALCCIKLAEGFAAATHAKRALLIEPENIKAIFRLAQAYQIQERYTKSVEVYKRVLEREHENKAAKVAIALCQRQAKKTMDKQKGTFSKMLKGFDTDKIKEGKPDTTQKAKEPQGMRYLRQM